MSGGVLRALSTLVVGGFAIRQRVGKSDGDEWRHSVCRECGQDWLGSGERMDATAESRGRLFFATSLLESVLDSSQAGMQACLLPAQELKKLLSVETIL